MWTLPQQRKCRETVDETRKLYKTNHFRRRSPQKMRARFSPLVIIRATKVIAALGADQLAVVPAQPMAAIRANLAMMVHRRSFRRGGSRENFILCTGLQCARKLGKHGQQISMEKRATPGDRSNGVPPGARTINPASCPRFPA